MGEVSKEDGSPTQTPAGARMDLAPPAGAARTPPAGATRTSPAGAAPPRRPRLARRRRPPARPRLARRRRPAEAVARDAARPDERMHMALLEVRNVNKVYKTRLADPGVEALRDVSCAVGQGEFVAIMGESGSGKTTLLNILAALDTPTSGQVLLQGQDLTRVRERNLATFRREHLGFVFQDFNLLDELTVRDNIFLPLVLAGTPHAEMERRMQPLVKSLGIAQLVDHFPYELSGGQKQRVAMARALITRPEILLADEPTGALDSSSSAILLAILQRLNARGQTILMVTHSVQAASHASRVLFLKDGTFRRQLRRGEHGREEFYRAISRTLESMTARDQGGARA